MPFFGTWHIGDEDYIAPYCLDMPVVACVHREILQKEGCVDGILFLFLTAGDNTCVSVNKAWVFSSVQVLPETMEEAGLKGLNYLSKPPGGDRAAPL